MCKGTPRKINRESMAKKRRTEEKDLAIFSGITTIVEMAEVLKKEGHVSKIQAEFFISELKKEFNIEDDSIEELEPSMIQERMADIKQFATDNDWDWDCSKDPISLKLKKLLCSMNERYERAILDSSF